MRTVSKLRSLASIGVILGIAFGCQDQSSDVSSVLRQVRDGASLKVRQDACSRLAEMPGDAAAEALMTLLGDDEHWYCAAHGLGLRKEIKAIVPLLMQLEAHGSRQDKYVWALGEIGDPSVLPQLLEVQRKVDVSTSDGRRADKEVGLAIAKLRGGNPGPTGG